MADTRLLMTGGALALALAAGFGLAKLTGRPPATEAETAASPPPRDTVAVAPEHLAVMQIAVEEAASSPFAAGIEAAGIVSASPGGEAVVTAQASGAVIRLSKRLGDPVRSGEVLATVSSREAAGMAADRSVADARAALARSNLARERRLFEQKVTPRQDLEKAEAELAAAEAEARRARTVAAAAHVAGPGGLAVVSPVSGRITQVSATLGAYVEPQTELFHIADPTKVQIEASVTGAEAARLKPGDTARVVTSTGATLQASVRSVTPTVSAETRAATVLVALPAGASVIPGEAVKVQFAPRVSGPAVVIVPEEAVQSVNGRDVVFLRTRTGFKAQPVTVSARSGGRAAIASGLAAGQSVATRNAFLLKAELTKGQEEEE
jgi:cobalt-zinc-cadmium efflux system membrane fusion protein